ncbi:hypothetical protein ES332_D05G304300v1 [Gossypium tomentosum]|uniref:Major facilitator superfamily (MFS) profile domain-containing protein n=1 Tax=Gossypium tomentosum TaxID=34277 RepID=A0A5D2L227_GOSTO|nr:hypothetical protein ES332_D05G304300v1 [Gossypium tomentosum]
MGPLGESTATAAVQVNTWSGVVSLLSLLGVFVADTFLGRCRTIILASLLYILIVAFGQCGFKPCIQAFGADQFARQNLEECKVHNSFFNWWYFALCAATFVTLWILPDIQKNFSWVLGFGIPPVVIVVVLVVFILGTTTYGFCVKRNEKNPFLKIGRVFILAVRNWSTASSAIVADEEARGSLPTESFKKFMFLNKALLAPGGSKEQGNVCSIGEVEEANTVIRLAPIWATSLFYAVANAQTSTFFTKKSLYWETGRNYNASKNWTWNDSICHNNVNCCFSRDEEA